MSMESTRDANQGHATWNASFMPHGMQASHHMECKLHAICQPRLLGKAPDKVQLVILTHEMF